ncbi:hypothetical protein [Tateyamaria sp. syn59]|uniref:hypothetical protein n=1 Tax=Tateyamaria sp. syn59 TaxID=2576942 RepID=UPI0011BF603C|nr:hypothetical protein [Tateyamaria sp. syn59]
MTEQYEEGALVVGTEMTLPYLWTSLHLNARMEQQLADKPQFAREGKRFSREIEALLKALQDVEAERWLALCRASGMTIFGVIGLSWCSGATREMLWSAWDACPYDIQPQPGSERPLHFLHPAFKPNFARLSEIIAACGNDDRHACFAIAALADRPLEIDTDLKEFELGYSTELRSLVQHRHLDQTNTHSEHD